MLMTASGKLRFGLWYDFRNPPAWKRPYDQLYGEIFEPLRDRRLFQQVHVNPETNTIEWPNGADLAPEFLYEIGTEVKQVA